jgi:arylsulfatase A-like enzyme
MENVLLITIDSLRADHVGYHGYERDTTPVLDQYAKQGSRFMNAHAHVGGTRFSFPSILTGVTPLMHGGYERISDSQTLLSEAFDGAGYRTGGFHSNLYLSADFGYDRGWDEFFDSADDSSMTSSLRRWLKTNFEGTPLLSVLQRAYDFFESSSGVNVGSYHVPADEITDRAIDFLESDDDTPTFLWVHYMDVHHPFLPPEKYQRFFREEPVSDRESIKLRRKFAEEPNAVTEEERQTFIDLYDAEIRFNDAEIGRLIDVVEEEWGDEYLFGLTADHGEHLLEHGYFSGAQAMDVKTHVPLFITGWDDNQSYDELVGLTDLPATLIDATGLEIPDSYEGHSLRQLVSKDEWPREYIAGGWGASENKDYVIRENEWKLIKRPDAGNELYHLSEDPSEQQNVVDDYPEQRSRLNHKLKRHLQQVEETNDDSVKRPDIDEEAKERLRRLGYQE